MALTTSEEALVRQLLDQQAAILSLAGNEATITSKLGATKVTLADLVAANGVADADLLLMRQGTTDKSVTPLLLKGYTQDGMATQKGVQAGDYNTSVAAGTADAITADFTPNVALTNGTTVIVRAGVANTTTTPTFSPDGLTAKTIVKGNNLALTAGDIAGAGHWLLMQYDATLDKWVLLNPATGIVTPPVGALSPIRQTVLGCPVDSNGYPSYLPETSGSLSLTSKNITSGAPLVVTSANGFTTSGAVDRVGISTSNLTWPSLTPSATNYLYVDVGSDGALTPGSTTLAPTYKQGGYRSTAAGQATFNASEMYMTVGNGSSAAQTYRVFVGEATTGASDVTSAVAYAIRGMSESSAFALAATTTYNFNHNIGTDLIKLSAYFICTAAQSPWVVGDKVTFESVTPNASASYPTNILAVKSRLSAVAINNAAQNLNRLGGLAITDTSWAIKVYAERNF